MILLTVLDMRIQFQNIKIKLSKLRSNEMLEIRILKEYWIQNKNLRSK